MAEQGDYSITPKHDGRNQYQIIAGELLALKSRYMILHQWHLALDCINQLFSMVGPYIPKEAYDTINKDINTAGRMINVYSNLRIKNYEHKIQQLLTTIDRSIQSDGKRFFLPSYEQTDDDEDDWI